MKIINISTIARLAEKNTTVKNVLTWTIQFMLQLLSAQKLIDDRKLQNVSLDWERGTLNLGNTFMEQLTARAISKYYIDRKLRSLDFKGTGMMKSDDDSTRSIGMDKTNIKF